MCILLKLDYAKFGVSNLFFQKLSKKNLWGSARPPPPPLGKGRVKLSRYYLVSVSSLVGIDFSQEIFTIDIQH